MLHLWGAKLSRKLPAVGPLTCCRLLSKGAGSCGDDASTCGKSSQNKAEQRCKRNRRKGECSKKRTPFPSYSECKRKPTAPGPAKECDCCKLDK